MKKNATELLFSRGIIPKDFVSEMSENYDDSSLEEYRDGIDEKKKMVDPRYKVLQRFDTLRYMYLTPDLDGQPKSIIDLSQRNPQLYVEGKYYEKDKIRNKTKWQVHRVMEGLCKREEINRKKEVKKIVHEEKLIIHHYLGS